MMVPESRFLAHQNAISQPVAEVPPDDPGNFCTGMEYIEFLSLLALRDRNSKFGYALIFRTAEPIPTPEQSRTEQSRAEHRTMTFSKFRQENKNIFFRLVVPWSFEWWVLLRISLGLAVRTCWSDSKKFQKSVPKKHQKA